MAAPMLSTLTAAPAAAKPSLIVDLGEDVLSLPAQAEDLTRELYHWLRTDSLSVLAGVAVGVVLYLIFLLLRGWARRRLRRIDVHGSWGWVALKVVARTRSVFLLMAAIRIVTDIFGAPVTWQGLVSFLFTIAAALQGAFWAREFLLSLVERRASVQADPEGTMASAVGVLTVIINVVVWAIAGIILLDNLGVNVTALVAGLGIGGIAIGLAAQGIFSDLFAALSILLDRPFKRGDSIQVGGPTGIIGTVETIGLKTTRLRALSGEIVVVSNANLLNQQINNFADYTRRRVAIVVSVIYQTAPDKLAAIPDELRALVDSRPACTFDRACLTALAPSSLDFELVFFVEHGGLAEMLIERQAVLMGMIRRFAELEIEFAFPAQVSYLAGPDGLIVPPEGGAANVVKVAPGVVG